MPTDKMTHDKMTKCQNAIAPARFLPEIFVMFWKEKLLSYQTFRFLFYYCHFTDIKII